MTIKRGIPNMPKHTVRTGLRASVGPSGPARAAGRGSAVAAPQPRTRPWSRLRLLPVMVAVAVLALGLKVTDLFSLSGRKAPEIAMSAAIAQAKPPAPPAGQSAPPAQGAQPAAPGDAGSAAKKEDDEDSEVGGKTDFTRAEVELLQQLSERRAELDKRERDVELRDNLLRATEKRIEEKIAELKKIEGRIDALLKKHDEQEEQRLQSVVKIYETMKPKDAAKVMERLDMPILLDVAERMKTAKMAAIMAEMDATRARAVTTELATRRRLPTTGG